jgi:putative tryptophan/tyrosine transport system substrate-binding protein
MRRREFITLLSGGSAAFIGSLVASAQQQSGRIRRIGVLHAQADNADNRARQVAFQQELQRMGWTDGGGGNVRIDIRWGEGDADRIRKYAAELVALTPDVILTVSAAGVSPLLQATRSVPIVFVLVADPVGAGFVDSLARPGRNATGFTALEYSFGGKWLELLKEISPSVTRAMVIRDPTDSAGIGLFSAVQSAASSMGVELSPVNVGDVGEINRAFEVFARRPNGGLIVTASPRAFVHRDVIVAQAAQHKLPAVYFAWNFVAAGGLASYGPDDVDQFRRAAGYVDRILKGENPADLPVQAPTKYNLVINLKTAKSLGLPMPPALLARADEVIE